MDAAAVTDEALVLLAIEAAEAGAARGEVPIGAVVVDADGEVVARGWNEARSTGDRTRHAEMVAVAAAGPVIKRRSGEWGDCVLASTLEPCVMCWGAAMELGVGRVIYGLEAPANGGSSRVHDRERALQVDGGVLRTECRDLLIRWRDGLPAESRSDFIEALIAATA